MLSDRTKRAGRPRYSEFALAQSSFDGVLCDVRCKLFHMMSVADDVIKILGLPYLTCLPQETIDFMGGERFPRVEDFLQRVFTQRRHQHVDMIRHDHKRAEFVALAIKVTESLLHCVGHFSLAEQAFAAAGVEPLLQPVGEPSLILGTGGFVVRLRMLGQPLFLFGVPLPELVLWQ